MEKGGEGDEQSCKSGRSEKGRPPEAVPAAARGHGLNCVHIQSIRIDGLVQRKRALEKRIIMENQSVENVPVGSLVEGEGAPENSLTEEQIIQYLQENDSKVLELKQKFDSLLGKLEFLVADPWIDSVIKAFKRRDIEKRLEKQFEKIVRKQLMEEASNRVEPGESIKTPTQEEIDKRVTGLLDKRKKEIKIAKDAKLRKARKAIKGSI